MSTRFAESQMNFSLLLLGRKFLIAKLLFVGRGRAMKICRLICPKLSLMMSRATNSRMAHVAAEWHYPPFFICSSFFS